MTKNERIQLFYQHKRDIENCNRKLDLCAMNGITPSVQFVQKSLALVTEAADNIMNILEDHRIPNLSIVDTN